MPGWDSYEVGQDLPREGSTSTGGTIPPPTQPVSPYPGLVRRGAFWYDAEHNQWYDQNFQKLPYDPTVSRYPEQNPTNPNDIPITQEPNLPDGPAPFVRFQPDPNNPGNYNVNTTYPNNPNYPSTANIRANYLGTATPWTPQGPQQIANPMPGRPQIGTAPMQAYQSWALQQGRSGGTGDAFRPWGFPVGQVSQILRYGGSPNASEQGGFAGTPGGAGTPLPPITSGGGWSGSGGGAGPGGGGLPGRTGGYGTGGYTPPPGGGGFGLPGAQDRDPVVSTIGGITQSQLDELRRMRTRNTADQPADINPLTVNQLRLLLATQGAILRGQ